MAFTARRGVGMFTATRESHAHVSVVFQNTYDVNARSLRRAGASVPRVGCCGPVVATGVPASAARAALAAPAPLPVPLPAPFRDVNVAR